MGHQKAKWMAGAVVALACVQPGNVFAQALADLPVRELRGEVQKRYDAALAAATDTSVVSANSNVYTWASEAKVQCGIALGFLKSGIKDGESLRRCDFAYGMMTRRPSPTPDVPIAPPLPPADNCPPEVASTFFFDWDSIVAPADAGQSVAFMSDNRARCGWTAFTVVGHTDRSGSDAYNDKLSVARARVIADMMGAAGIPADTIAVSGRGEKDLRVETLDGERTPANRRVEVRVNGMGER
ncbi:OmpA family protein [Sphingopyxis witflariensis]|uniref:Cell envelope biogenesis protein OmpA n=1 Tax=Sphingopyxis witflariensis TaxID=173675 RepID=A0A246JK61_9SPHN|nr:OmpA family protein [Sphingopyxis witflariensis]OWQ92883.1 cell envelope biogenesis protein OmpA [Sphingopyxis witflariensis]